MSLNQQGNWICINPGSDGFTPVQTSVIAVGSFFITNEISTKGYDELALSFSATALTGTGGDSIGILPLYAAANPGDERNANIGVFYTPNFDFTSAPTTVSLPSPASDPKYSPDFGLNRYYDFGGSANYAQRAGGKVLYQISIQSASFGTGLGQFSVPVVNSTRMRFLIAKLGSTNTVSTLIYASLLRRY